jgi:hypothetical protein
MALKECTKKEEANAYELVVSVDGETFEKAINKVYKREVKKINIQGFRKGKAPRRIIEKMYGTEVFYDDAMQDCYPEALYELGPRAQEFMLSVILKNLPKWKRVTIMVSHDIFVMPLAVFGSQKKVALKYYEDYHWINYIAGLAVIADEQNNLRYVPVKGTESGVIDYLAIYMAEHGGYSR